MSPWGPRPLTEPGLEVLPEMYQSRGGNLNFGGMVFQREGATREGLFSWVSLDGTVTYHAFLLWWAKEIGKEIVTQIIWPQAI